MASDTGETGRDRSADIFTVSFRKVGDGVATSRDGNWDEAEATLTSAFTTAPQRSDGPAGSGTAAELERLARLFAAHCADGRYGEAVVAGEQIVAYHRRYYGRYHHRTVRWTGRLGEAYLRGGDPGRAGPLLGFALTALESLRGGDDPETRHCRLLYDAALAAQRRPGPLEDAP